MIFSLSLYKLSMQISIISSSGMLINKESTSRLAIYKLRSSLNSYSKKMKWSVTVYLSSAKGFKNGNNNLGTLQVGIPIADKVVQKDLSLFLVSFCAFYNPYKTPTGLMVLLVALSIILFFFLFDVIVNDFLKVCYLVHFLTSWNIKVRKFCLIIWCFICHYW